MNQRPFSLTIRPETAADHLAIRHVNEQAFGQPDEANIVDALRQRGAAVFSLVAVQGEQIVGHIFFSPVTIQDTTAVWSAVALGPMAVLPSHQRLGIGSQLVQAGLAACLAIGELIVIVLGHPQFYPRFGFRPSQPLGIRWDRDVREEVFMVAELRAGVLNGRGGVVSYPPEFG
jgi:putative acetyltransferase